MGAQDYRPALVPQLEDYLFQQLPVHWIEPGEGFIKDDEVRLVSDGDEELYYLRSLLMSVIAG